jgi:tetratricopeptide (TPR) repeat protein
MELVRGIAITDYCDQARLSIRQRLELFIQVCRAVQHAHTKGIIHRDLKPTNVLVTSNDGVPVPKIIDFGVAKALERPLTDRTLHTGFAQMIGTPLYMSPEQAELNLAGVDTRSDIYSLGVLLYELLTGTTPFDKDRLRSANFDELRRILREEEPPRPSGRASTLGANLPTVSDRRNLDQRKLGDHLKGELDWIVMKSLEKDRTRRYETASAFAADVQRYLNDEPVEACPPSRAYRLRKFVRRNRQVLATAAVIAMVLVTATTVCAWQAVVARDAQRQAEFDRDRAERSERQAKGDQGRARTAEQRAKTDAAIALAVSEFLQRDLLQNVDPVAQHAEGFTPQPDLTVKEALHRAAARIGDRFHGQPLVEAAIRRTIGLGYRNIAENRLVVPHFERAYELQMAHLGADHPETYETCRLLANAYRWAGKRKEAIVLLEKLLNDRTAAFGPDHMETINEMELLAEVCENAGDCHRAKLLFEQCLKKRQTIIEQDNGATAACMAKIAWTNAMVGNLDESLNLYVKAVELFEATVGPQHLATCGCIKDHAEVLQRAGKLDEADRILRLALERGRKLDRPGAKILTALILDHLGRNLLLQRKYSEAEFVLRETTDIHATYRPNVWRRFSNISLLGGALLGQKQYAAAEPLLLQGYEGMEQRYDLMQAAWKYRLPEAAEFLVRLYEETNQPKKAQSWREKRAPV